MDHIKHL